MAASSSKREAIEVAAKPLRELLREEHDEIAAAKRALRQAEKEHLRAIERAERRLCAAQAAEPLAAYGHQVLLYTDCLSTADGNHPLTPDVRARLERRTLVIEGPDWRHEVPFQRRDERKVRKLAEEIEAAAADAKAQTGEAEDRVEQAEKELAAAREDRRGIVETRTLIHRLGEVVEEDEDVLDMAPGISAGHDGVLVATDRRLLFIGIRRSLSFPYEKVSDVGVKGRFFGSRLALSTPTGKGVFSGLLPAHAAELADLVRSRIGGNAVAR